MERELLNPTRLSLEEAARVLGLDRGVLEADVEAGAPTNPDGTINLVQYAAWLNRLLRDGDPPDAAA